VKKLIEENKDNQEKVFKNETERLNKEIQEKSKAFEEKCKKTHFFALKFA
jgi:hypothetical protein